MQKLIRKAGFAALMLPLLALPAMVSAQQTTPVSFGVSGGLSVPTGNLGDAVDGGYNIAGHIWLRPGSIKSVVFRGDVSYDNWGAKVGNLKYRALGVTANAIIHPAAPNSSVVPYLIGGGGFFNTKSYTGTSSNENTNTDLGLQVGGGIEFKLSGFSTFAEAKFVNAFSDGNNTNWIPITFGIRF
jgi:Outer membrane protein beta-barrel domain